MFGGVNNIVARHGVDGQHRNGEIHCQIMRGARRVARFVIDRSSQGVAAIGQCLKVCRRNVNTPAAIGLHRCLIGLHGRAIERYRNNLPRFSGGTAAHRHTRIGFAGVDDIVAGDGIDNDGRGTAIDAVVMHRRGAIAIDIADVGLRGGAAIG
ncbi:hypothetical protein MUTS6_35480 [Escherichia coli]|nr:hypothetical protein MUTS6_35480 [Escherichia coli]